MSTAQASAKEMEIPAFCFLKISIAGVVQKQPIVIQLNSKECPKTCQNFVALCTSPETTSRQSPCPSYRGCEFHRIIDDFMVQGGDFERFDGTGGYSPIHHGVGGKFADENLKGKHDQAGIVSMANAGKNTNKSQFFITVKATPHLDGKHVVFGKVVTGMQTLKEIVSVEREGDRPVSLQRVVICDCGVGKGDEEESGWSSSDREQESSKEERRHKKKRKKRSRKYDDSSSSDDDSSSSSEEEERHRKKRKRRSKDSSSDDESSSYERRKKKKKKRHRKEHRHKKKKRKHRDRSPR
jgi:cyclophilin family peptidyl-prolyl cis-trans isomerase